MKTFVIYFSKDHFVFIESTLDILTSGAEYITAYASNLKKDVTINMKNVLFITEYPKK